MRSLTFFLIVSLTAALASASSPTMTPTFSSTFTSTATDTRTRTFTATSTVTAGSTTASPTRTVTPTFTSTATVTSTRTETPLAPVSDTRTYTSTPSTTFTLTATPTQTFLTAGPSATRTPSSTISPSPSASPSFTASPPPTAVPTLTVASTPVIGPKIDDFEDGDLIGANGGSCHGVVDAVGSDIDVTLTGGSTLTLSTAAAHCHGDLMPGSSYASMRVDIFPGAAQAYPASAVACHCVTFSYQGDYPGAGLNFSLITGSGNDYQYIFVVPDTSWHQVTVYFPDVTDPSLTPRFNDNFFEHWSSGGADIRSLGFGPTNSGAYQPYSFSIDDIYFGEPDSNNSRSQVAGSLGLPVDQVEEAYSYHLDEQLTWVVLRLAAHCGCRPHQIMTMRETRSWGQIAIDLGTTWAAVLAEVDAAPLADPVNDAIAVSRSLLNGVLPPPGTRAQYYVPANQYVLPPATGGCP